MWIDVFSDVVCPWCFIGKRRLERALARHPLPGVEIRWRAFQLNPMMPRRGMDRAAYLAGKFGGAARAEQVYETIRRMGDGEGIDFDFSRISRTPNTVDAHRVIRFAQAEGGGEPVVEGLFRAYFLEGRDLGDRATLADIAGAAGLDRQAVADYLATEEGRGAVEADCVAAGHLGINGVPFFIFNGRYAVSGAQEPDALFPIFDLMQQESADSAGASRAAE